MKCPNTSCRFATPHADHMEDHKRKTRHGMEGRKVEWTTVSTGKAQLRVRVKHQGPKQKKSKT